MSCPSRRISRHPNSYLPSRWCFWNVSETGCQDIDCSSATLMLCQMQSRARMDRSFRQDMEVTWFHAKRSSSNRDTLTSFSRRVSSVKRKSPDAKLIVFCSDFDMLKEIYSVIMTTPASRRLSPGYFSPHSTSGSNSQSQPDLMGTHGFKHRHVAVYSHAEFLQGFGDESSISGTTTKDKTNVMLSMYKNAKFMF